MFDPSTDTKPPQFDVSCPVHVTVVARGGKNSASVRWGRITARDNSGNVKVTPKNIKQPQIMVEGRHTIPYMAEDAEKNRQFCDVNINVIGELLNDNLKRWFIRKLFCWVDVLSGVCMCLWNSNNNNNNYIDSGIFAVSPPNNHGSSPANYPTILHPYCTKMYM